MVTQTVHMISHNSRVRVLPSNGPHRPAFFVVSGPLRPLALRIFCFHAFTPKNVHKFHREYPDSFRTADFARLHDECPHGLRRTIRTQGDHEKFVKP